MLHRLGLMEGTDANATFTKLCMNFLSFFTFLNNDDAEICKINGFEATFALKVRPESV